MQHPNAQTQRSTTSGQAGAQITTHSVVSKTVKLVPPAAVSTEQWTAEFTNIMDHDKFTSMVFWPTVRSGHCYRKSVRPSVRLSVCL